MIFPHEFYEDEIRCDYLIPSMVKRTWAAQIEILSDLDKACTDNGLSYFAEWGTLLGAVRHGGFIPWDDDVDVCMKRKDYEIFTNNVKSLMSHEYSIVNYRSNRDFKQMLSRVVSSDHYRFDPEYMKKYSGLPFALGIDIFPLDYLTDDEEYEKDRERRVKLVYDAVNEIAHFGTDPKDLSEYLKKVEKETHLLLDRNKDILTQLRAHLEKLFAEVDEKDAKFITLYPLWMNHHRYMFPKDAYDNSVRMMFENTTVPVPVRYDEILRMKYSDSYMTPIRSGGAHEYPYYEQHEEVLKEHFGFEWPKYKFNESDLKLRKYVIDVANKRVVFVTYSAEAFSNMRRVVKKYISDGADVTILPVAKFDIAPDMSGIVPFIPDVPDEYYLKGCEGAKVSHDSKLIDEHPDVIVTNYPYDEYNLITTLDKTFYSLALKERCDMLVYVPYLEQTVVSASDERSKKLMPLYVCTKLAAVCDRIIVKSEEMRARYIECLCVFSGDEYKDRWEDKMIVLPEDETETDHLPAGKKKILFYLGIASFAQFGTDTIEKIKEVFEIFDSQKDKVDVVYFLQDGLLENLKEMYPKLYELYEANDFREGDERFDTDDIDAYYGEASMYATEFLKEKKPVMIWNVQTGGR